MTPTPADLTEPLARQLSRLAERAAISDLIDRYTVILDDQDRDGFDATWPRAFFTEDCRLDFPIGGHHGLDGLAEFHHRAKRNFTATHHLSSNHLIRLDGDRADVRFQMIAVHLHPRAVRERAQVDPGELFRIGGHYEGETVRTPDGWRFSRWTFHVVWTDGVSPAELA
ncbi:nuclear transport factor 2 family protein [Streptomyces griseiscabiei]|uniref:Nuclear transport factor 2 family protein n=1 Tax=Streptomyces griseiscabiei TaxID=2993540 RepID=A0ABU4LH10_9ACTN|nr:nuclear transport factor 2 family protein [Streptomyces griseiscabiei]MBZ3907932.1 nuclear transport factor 2 family protein [Streptomyces griseiscabiei]MDX2915080.1 nuclear transport factor 2 family protein [Streptomyces griseiscabiei]